MTHSAIPGIVIWTEGGQMIGMGHLFRSLVVAEKFLDFGHMSCFVINDDPVSKESLLARGFSYELGRLDGETVPPILGESPKTIVFDTKKDVTTIIGVLKQLGHKIVVLDNATPARLCADVVIHPALCPFDDLDWTGFDGLVCGGAEYVLVHETYVEAREKCRLLRHQPPYRVLVTLGGSDPRQLTYHVVSSLRDLDLPIDVDVVIGPVFVSDSRLTELEQSKEPRLRFIRGLTNLSPLMADSHIAITALGTTLYELAAMGVPALIIANYAEDRRDMEFYKGLGMNLPIGFYEDVTPAHIQEAVSLVLRDITTWESMRRKGWQIIDGHGARRVVECILGHI